MPNLRVMRAHLVILAAMLALSAWAWIELPADASIAIHWNVHGRPDRWAGKLQAVSMMPAMLLFVQLARALSHRVEPRRRNLVRSIAAHRIVALAASALLAVAHLGVLGTALGWPVSIATLVLVSVGVFFVVTGNLYGKLRSNHAAGVRNRWTLADDTVWGLTQRFTGRALVVLGLVVTSSPWWSTPSFALCLLLAGVLVIAGASTLVSYLSWRRVAAARNR